MTNPAICAKPRRQSTLQYIFANGFAFWPSVQQHTHSHTHKHTHKPGSSGSRPVGPLKYACSGLRPVIAANTSADRHTHSLTHRYVHWAYIQQKDWVTCWPEWRATRTADAIEGAGLVIFHPSVGSLGGGAFSPSFFGGGEGQQPRLSGAGAGRSHL